MVCILQSGRGELICEIKLPMQEFELMQGGGVIAGFHGTCNIVTVTLRACGMHDIHHTQPSGHFVLVRCSAYICIPLLPCLC